MFANTHETYAAAETIISKIDTQINLELNNDVLDVLKNNLLFIRTIKTSLNLYEMHINKSITKLLL